MKAIPFFANLPDGTHCYQAALKMLLHYFTGRDFSFEQLDRITGKLEGKWTWPTLSLLWLLDQGFEVNLVEEFDYDAFAQRGKDYLIERYGEEVAEAQAVNSDLPLEQKRALDFSKKVFLENRTPVWEDLKKMFDDGYRLICNINAAPLYQQTGYSGHFVVPVQIMPDALLIHDPGLPPNPFFKVSREVFERAWGYPTKKEKNILALRLKKGLQKNTP